MDRGVARANGEVASLCRRQVAQAGIAPVIVAEGIERFLSVPARVGLARVSFHTNAIFCLWREDDQSQ